MISRIDKIKLWLRSPEDRYKLKLYNIFIKNNRIISSDAPLEKRYKAFNQNCMINFAVRIMQVNK